MMVKRFVNQDKRVFEKKRIRIKGKLVDVLVPEGMLVGGE